jgi:hypothetical protein
MIGSGTLPKQRGPKKIMAKRFFIFAPGSILQTKRRSEQEGKKRGGSGQSPLSTV